MWKYNSAPELYHYGVLGMKWGVRRSQKQLEKAAKYRKKGDKETANKLKEKANKSLTKHKNRVGDKAFDRISNTSTGKLFAESLLMGSGYGALKYNQARAKGDSRAKAFVKTVLYSNANFLTSGVLSVAEPRIKEQRAKRKEK